MTDLASSPDAPTLTGPIAPRRPGTFAPLGIDDVRLRGGFWGDRQRLNADRLLPHAVEWIHRVGTVDNFLPPEQRATPERRGVLFTDSDVYKVLEALAWEVGREPNEKLAGDLQELTSAIAAAMEEDGYVNTYWGAYTDRERYTDLQMGHELYCMGHLIQAGVARHRTTGEDELFRLVCRAADHIVATFGDGGPIPLMDGHPEVETALVELYRITGEQKYLTTAKQMIDRRGQHLLGESIFGSAYYQDEIPLREAPVMRGHAVRALYLAAGAVDVAVETGDEDLLAAVVRQWENTVARRTYVTGGMGSRHRDEAYGEDFELPPDRSYSETCAGIAAAMLSQRLLLATGDPRYADLVERVLYNIVAPSVSAEGTSFFYTNTLHRRIPSTPPPTDSESSHADTGMRAPWFSVPCCPPNVSRTLATVGSYVATTDAEGVQVHQYAPGTVRTAVAAGPVTLEVETGYPYDGAVVLRVSETPAASWVLSLRVPAWATGATVSVNGEGRPAAPGLVRLERTWQADDVVRLDLPVAPRWTRPDPRIDAVRGCVAVEAGPLVYALEALEGAELDLDRVEVDPAQEPQPVDVPGLPGLPGYAVRLTQIAADDELWPYAPVEPVTPQESVEGVLLPYFAWANRGPSTMRIWLPALQA